MYVRCNPLVFGYFSLLQYVIVCGSHHNLFLNPKYPVLSQNFDFSDGLRQFTNLPSSLIGGVVVTVNKAMHTA